MTSTKGNFEAAMETLEKIVEDLESGDFSLEDSMKKFEQGLKLGGVCKDILDKAEKKVKLLVENDEGKLQEKDAADDL